MKIKELQKKIADALNGVEELVQAGCTAFAEDSREVYDRAAQLVQEGRVAIVVARLKLTLRFLDEFSGYTIVVRSPSPFDSCPSEVVGVWKAFTEAVERRGERLRCRLVHAGGKPGNFADNFRCALLYIAGSLPMDLQGCCFETLRTGGVCTK